MVDDNIVNNNPTKKSYLKWLQVQWIPKGGQSEKIKQKVTQGGKWTKCIRKSTPRK
jgi:hypothetical protein